MRSPGSVLIVVLGLLAILAVVGLTFVTMSSIDRRTAANFALQSQFMLAADGAVDYVCHHLIQDLWYYDPKTALYHDHLLTDQNGGAGEEVPLARNEPFDYPSDTYDPWLSSPPEYTAGQGLSIPGTGHFSYGNQGGTHYGLTSWGLGTPQNERPNNLGWPTAGQVRPYTTGNGHGVWIPDLSFPFDVGLIRVSVTVLDHGAMTNLNAHGRSSASVGECPRYGYFISDVDPQHFGFDVQNLLNGAGQVPGLWREQDKPYNDHLYKAIIENPGRYGDKPFTLDEEFELRRLIGTHFQSRLEEFGGGNLDSAPDTASDTTARNRLSLTTISWTSEVRPDFEGPGGEVFQVETKLPGGDDAEYAEWSPRKIDLNLDTIEEIKNAMAAGYVFDETDEVSRKIRNQLLANIAAFRDGSGTDDPEDPEDMPIKTWPEAGNRVGAAPQPVFSKIKITKEGQEQNEDGDVETIWAVKVQVVSPWRGNVFGDKDGLAVDDMILNAIPIDESGTSITWDEPVFPLPERMLAGKPWTFTAKVTTQDDAPVASALKCIDLKAAGMTIDRIESSLLADLSANDARHREIYRELERRRPNDTESIDVVYIGKWVDGDGGGMNNFSFAADNPSGIPIRFPRSVKVSTAKEDTADRTLPEKGLPPYPMTDDAGEDISFRAFARLADLNQVLCPTREDYAGLQEGEDGFWPWVTRVAEKAGLTGQALLEAEERLKFNWNDTNLPTPGNYSRMNAANVFCVGGPWLDELDNDGDGCADEDGTTAFPTADEGIGPEDANDDKGRFGGPELRVAGKINLNTATDETLRALAKTFDFQKPDSPPDKIWDLFVDYVKDLRNQEAIVTPAQIVTRVQDADVLITRNEFKGAIERRDLPYTLISNVATVRSDTFSIYGTIEYGHVQGRPPTNTSFKTMRRRRFWALVDRSPCLAYYPGPRGHNPKFIRPRILNFQWLD